MNTGEVAVRTIATAVTKTEYTSVGHPAIPASRMQVRIKFCGGAAFHRFYLASRLRIDCNSWRRLAVVLG